MGKDWHPQCFKCVECGRFLDPGRLLEVERERESERERERERERESTAICLFFSMMVSPTVITATRTCMVLRDSEQGPVSRSG